MIWATVSSRSCFCWVYRGSPSSAAKNIICVILMLTIWWCPRVESPLVLLEESVCYDQCVLLVKLCYLMIKKKKWRSLHLFVIVVAQTQMISWRNHKKLITLVAFGKEPGNLGQGRRKTWWYLTFDTFWILNNVNVLMLTILKVSLNFQHYRKCQMYRKIEGILPNTMSPLQRITLNILLD